MNQLGSYRRLGLALGAPLDELAARIAGLVELQVPSSLIGKVKALGQLRELASYAPKIVKKAAFRDVVVAPPDLARLPVLTTWPGDGGPFITLPIVVTKDAQGRRNAGVYRLQVYDGQTTGMHIHIHHDGAANFREAGDLHAVAGLAEVGGAVMVDVDVHAGRLPVVDLQAVHAGVAAALGVLGDHDRQGDEGTAVAGPRGQHRQARQVRRVDDHVAERRLLDDLGGVGGELTELAERLDLADEAARHLELDEAGDARRELVERRPEGKLEPPIGAELVHQHGGGQPRRTGRPVRPLEEQRRPVRLAGAVGDLGHLEVGVDLGAHAGQLALAFQQVDEGAQVHGHLPAGSDGAATGSDDAARLDGAAGPPPPNSRSRGAASRSSRRRASARAMPRTSTAVPSATAASKRSKRPAAVAAGVPPRSAARPPIVYAHRASSAANGAPTLRRCEQAALRWGPLFDALD